MSALTELPAGIVGNGSLLATISRRGRIEQLCWPNVDWAEQLGELRLGIARDGETAWLDEAEAGHEQRYLDGTAAFATRSRAGDLSVEVLDFAPPERPVLVRRVRGEVGTGRLVVYCRPELAGRRRYGGAFVDAARQAVVFYCRDHALALALKEGGHATCDRVAQGPSKRSRHARPATDAAAGIVEGTLTAPLDGELTVLAAFGDDPRAALAELDGAIAAGAGGLLRRRVRHDELRVDDAEPPLAGPAGLEALYRRSLLVLDLLTDRQTGGMIAAPELDPDFIRSGGYGFVWARDQVYALLAFLASGRHDLAAAAAAWLVNSQSPDGLWAQRHWTNGRVAPSWCAHQLDETGAALVAFGAVSSALRDERLDGHLRPAARRAAEHLLSIRDPHTGLPSSSVDLWEERQGLHAYTVAATIAGLRAASVLVAPQDSAGAERYAAAAEEMRESLERLFWSEALGRYVRSLGDDALDVSLLGLAWPFAVVDPAGDRMRATAAAVAQGLELDDGGVLRYEGDGYIGGNRWILASIWLGLWRRQAGDQEGLQRALAYAIECQSEHGLLAEQVDADGRPLWVLPLAWSHAMLVLGARPDLPIANGSSPPPS